MAITFEGNFIPGRYLIFSFRVLITSLSFAVVLSDGKVTCSSKTHMLTSSLQKGRRAAFLPRTVAMAQPQLPLPIMHIFSASPSAVAIVDTSIDVLSFSSATPPRRYIL